MNMKSSSVRHLPLSSYVVMYDTQEQADEFVSNIEQTAAQAAVAELKADSLKVFAEEVKDRADALTLSSEDLKLSAEDHETRTAEIEKAVSAISAVITENTLDLLDGGVNLHILKDLYAKFGGRIKNHTAPLKFAVFSDIHLYKNNEDQDNLGYGNGIVDFTRALSIANNHGCAFACVAGDIGNDNSQVTYTDNAFDRCIEASGIGQNPYFSGVSCCAGNHDQAYTEEQWKSVTSCDWNFCQSVGVGTDDNPDRRVLFVFMSLDHIESGTWGGNRQDKPYTNGIEFLKKALDDHPDHTVFLFMHFPLNSQMFGNQWAGLGDVKYPDVSDYGAGYNRIHNEGFKLDGNWRNEQNEEITKILSEYDGTVLVFNGHTHFMFDCDRYSKNINYKKITDRLHDFHVPSLNYPRDRDRHTIAEGYPAIQPSQGYIVEVYDDKVVVGGYEFCCTKQTETGELMRRYIVDLV